MSTDQRGALVLVGLLLAGTLFGATVAVGADRTVFDSEYASNTFEDEDVYGEITRDIRENVSRDIDEIIEAKPVPRGITLTLDGKEVGQQAVTEGVVSTEMDQTLTELYRYLHGERADLNISIDLTGIRASVSATIVVGIEIETPTLVGSKSDRIDAKRIARLSENASAYQEAEMDITHQERAKIAEELEANARVELNEEDEKLTDAVLAHQQTVLDGLTGQRTYDEYNQQLSADEARIKEELAASLTTAIPDQEPVFSEDEDPESAFGPFRTQFQWGTTAAWLLPLLAIGLIAVGYGLTRSVDRTATVTGTASIVAGVVGVLAAVGGRLLLVDLLEPPDGSDPGPVLDGVISVVAKTVETIMLQSGLLVLAGGGVLAAVYADRQGKLRPFREMVGVEPRAESGEPGEADETDTADEQSTDDT